MALKLQILSVTLSDGTGGLKKESALASKSQKEKSNMRPKLSPYENLKGSSSRSSSVDLSSELEGSVNGHAAASSSPNSSSTISNKGLAHVDQSSSSSFNNENAEEEDSMYLRGNDHEYLAEVQKHVPEGKSAVNGDVEQNGEEIASNHFPAKVASPNGKQLWIAKIGSTNSWDSQVNGENDGNGKTGRTGKTSVEQAANSDDNCNSFMEDIERKEQDDDGLEGETFEERRHSTGVEALNFYSRDAIRNQVSLGSDSSSLSREDLGMKGNIFKSDRLKHVKSVRSSSDMARSNGHHKEVKENGVSGDAQNIAGTFRSNERKDTKVYPKDARSSITDSKIQQLEHKVKMLEAELREAAATEAALYSVVAEHGSSMSKVHAPARRLSRLYLHACNESSQSRRASAARSVVSGLVLVAKACGNDVPRYLKSHSAFP